jgi:hypothetical protein
MKIHFKSLKGQTVVIKFHNWQELMSYLKRNYPFIQISNEARKALG